MYFRDTRFAESKTWVPLALALLRFLGVTGLATLLLTPLLKQITEDTKKPQIVVLQDHSLSVTQAEESQDQSEYQTGINNMISGLSEDYDVSVFKFGETISAIDDTVAQEYKTTNISAAMQHVYDVFNDQNLGAVVLATDGLYNEGRNPLYNSMQFKAPIYTVGLGDTTIRKDLFIKNVLYNKIAYLGDKFNVQVDIQAFNAAGTSTKLRVRKEQGDEFNIISEKNIRLDKNQFFTTETITLDAAQPGINRYRLSVTQINGEQSTVNNVQDIYVEVLDSRLKILVLANAPHPDLAAMNQILGANKNYEIDVKYAGTKESLTGYDFYVFHNLPSRRHSIDAILPIMNRAKAPRLFVVGAQTNLAQFNKSQSTLNIKGNNSTQNDVQPIINQGFTAFNISDNTKNKLNQFTPVIAPFGEYSEGPKTSTLLYQKIGRIETKFPLLSFSDDSGIKTAVLAGEGIWKWKLFDYLQYQNFDIITDLLDKTFVYTSIKEDKRRFRSSVAKNIFRENENIYFDAELYNNAYQLINDPDAFVTIKNSKGESFPFTFSKLSNAYTLDAGRFPEGKYRYTASTNVGGETLTQDGRFTVQSIQLELFNTTADHSLLRSVSANNGGSFYLPEQIDQLSEDLKGNNRIKPTVYATTSTKPIIHYKWLFVVLFLILALEWFLRRFYGHY